jgi:signal peptidase I
MPVRGRTVRLASLVLLFALTIATVAVCAVVGLSEKRTITVGGISMEPTLQPGDTALYWPGHDIRRGDLVIAGIGPPGPGTPLVVRRVIGLPGDHVTCCTAQGLLAVNGRPLHENYLYPGNAPSARRFSVTLGPGQVWLMGDRRSVALDSRIRGPEPLEDITGRISMIGHDGHFADVRTPAAFIAAGLAPPDHRQALPYGWFDALIITMVVLGVELAAGWVLMFRSRRRRARQRGVSRAPPTG